MPTVYKLLPEKQTFFSGSGTLLSGGKLYAYAAGTTTPKATYTEIDGATTNANPIVLNARGEVPNGVFGTTGAYKLILTDASDATIWTRDNVYGEHDPANLDVSTLTSEWIASGYTPTRTGNTTFTTPGDSTAVFQVGRRLKCTDASTIYATVTAASYNVIDVLTTVTVATDSGNLSASLSRVDVHALSNKSFIASGTAASARTVQAKLRDFVSAKDFGAAGDGVTDDRANLINALLTQREVYIPAGDLKIASTIDFGALKTATGLENRNVVIVGEGAHLSRLLWTGTGPMLIGGQRAPAANGYVQALTLRGVSVVGTGSEGTGSTVTFGQFTTSVHADAGTTSTQTGLLWEFDAPALVADCEFKRLGTAIETVWGYGATIRDNEFRFNNIALKMVGGVTSMTIDTNLIQRNGIGIALYSAQLIRIINNILQGNYAGADIVSYNWNTMIDVIRNYFEVSPKCFVQNGDGGGAFTSNGFRFEQNKALEVDIVDFASHFTFRNNRMKSFAVGTTSVDNIVVEDNTDENNDGLTKFTNWTGAGAGNIVKRNAPLIASSTYNPPSLAAGATDSSTITVTGAALGDEVRLSFSNALQGVVLHGWVSAADTVQFLFHNLSGGVVDLASGTLRVWVSKA